MVVQATKKLAAKSVSLGEFVDDGEIRQSDVNINIAEDSEIRVQMLIKEI